MFINLKECFFYTGCTTLLGVHPNFPAVQSLATAERWFGHNVDHDNEEEDENERMTMSGW